MPSSYFFATVCSWCVIAAWMGCAAAPPESSESPTPLTQAASTPPAAWTLHRIADPEAADQTAFSLLVPAAWAVEGGLSWSSPQLYEMPTILDVRAVGPEGRAARFYPQMAFSYGQEIALQAEPWQPTAGGTLYVPPPAESIGQWLVELVHAFPAPGVSGAVLLEQSPLPAATQRFQDLRRGSYEMTEQTNQLYRDVMTPEPMVQGYVARAARVALGYQRDGLAVREDLIVFWEGWWFRQGDVVTTGGWSITGMQSAAGPDDSEPLRDPELVAIVRSAHFSGYWVDKMSALQRELQRIKNRNIPEYRPLSIDTEAQNREARRADRSWRDLMMDAWHEAASLEKADTPRNAAEAYAIPGGEKLKLPADFAGVITDGETRYFIGDDAVYDPDADAADKSDWQRLEPLPKEPRPHH